MWPCPGLGMVVMEQGWMAGEEDLGSPNGGGGKLRSGKKSYSIPYASNGRILLTPSASSSTHQNRHIIVI